jgi:hypothetical protein
MRRATNIVRTVAAIALALAAWTPARAEPPLVSGSPTWRPPQAEKVKADALAWLDAKKADAAARAKAAALWSNLPSPAGEDDLLARLAQTFALADANAAHLVSLCSSPRRPGPLAEQAWLREPGLPPLVAANLRLLYARWLVHQSLFDEAREQLAGLTPLQVVAPASLLFYQGVVDHALLNKDSGLKAIDELLGGADASPRRYVALARLMQEDLKGLEEDSLDHISRRMDDVRRRLNLGRAGPKVRSEEGGVIKSLDKIIKKLEDQQQQSAGAGGSLQPTSPAQKSQFMEGKGPGNVTKKDIGSGSGWGNLPPKEREEAMQQIGRDFPSHYRDVIEQYFRRLATEGTGEGKNDHNKGEPRGR